MDARIETITINFDKGYLECHQQDIFDYFDYRILYDDGAYVTIKITYNSEKNKLNTQYYKAMSTILKIMADEYNDVAQNV